jgi:hypothetical protein
MGPITAPAIQALEPPPLFFPLLPVEVSGEVSTVDTNCGMEKASEGLVDMILLGRINGGTYVQQ